MGNIRKPLVLVTAALAGAFAFAGSMPDVKRINLPGDYPGHLQDVCWDGSNTLYWAHTSCLLKTDLAGKILARQEVEGHNAGLEVKDGKIFVAVCILQGKTKGRTTPECHVQVNVHDPRTLALERKIVTDINDRAGSLCFLEDGTLLVGCLRHGELQPDEVRFHHLTAEGKLIKSHVVKLDHPVVMGIEVMKRRGNRIFLCIYGHDTVELDRSFKRVATHKFGGQVGLVFDGERPWVGETKRNAEKRYVSGLRRR